MGFDHNLLHYPLLIGLTGYRFSHQSLLWRH